MTASLQRISICQRVLFHQRMQIDHGVGAIFWIVAELFRSQATLEDTLQDHAIERAMPHAVLVLHEIRLRVSREINRLTFAHAVVPDERVAPLLRPMAEGLFVSVRRPKLE